MQFSLEFLQPFQFLSYVDQLRLQATAHRRARLHPASPQTQKAPDLAQFESQSLYAPDEGQSFNVSFAVLAKAAWRPSRSWQQRIALVEANRVNAHSYSFGDDTNLHRLGSSVEATLWSTVQSQDLFLQLSSVSLPVKSRESAAPMWTF
jgi:hypothetical protein